MAPQHAKSPCCSAPVRCFGGRRRQCIHCKRTWSIRKKRRGRKHTRHMQALLKRVLLAGHTLEHERRNFGTLSTGSIAARFAAKIRRFVAEPPAHFPKGPHTLIVDGVYFKFNRREWVLYLMAVKSLSSHCMYFLNPVLIKGRERLEAWHEAVNTIPREMKNQIQALVSDGLRGFQQLAALNGWVHQRCHFHLLASLVRGKGKRRYRTRGSAVRDQILVAVRMILSGESEQKRNIARRGLRWRANMPTCPPYVRKHILEFLEREHDFCAYLMHPHLNLPTTTSAMESTGRLIRKATRTARTPESLRLRAIAYLRLKQSVICNGFDTQN